MIVVLQFLARIVNGIHDLLVKASDKFVLTLTDKDLHFWIIGLIGLVVFVLTDIVFKKLAKWNISVISFIYTFTVLLVVIFSIEIEQKITKRGDMEFTDIVAGLWGFLIVLSTYLLLRFIYYYAVAALLIDHGQQKIEKQ